MQRAAPIGAELCRSQIIYHCTIFPFLSHYETISMKFKYLGIHTCLNHIIDLYFCSCWPGANSNMIYYLIPTTLILLSVRRNSILKVSNALFKEIKKEPVFYI